MVLLILLNLRGSVIFFFLFCETTIFREALLKLFLLFLFLNPHNSHFEDSRQERNFTLMPIWWKPAAPAKLKQKKRVTSLIQVSSKGLDDAAGQAWLQTVTCVNTTISSKILDSFSYFSAVPSSSRHCQSYSIHSWISVCHSFFHARNPLHFIQAKDQLEEKAAFGTHGAAVLVRPGWGSNPGPPSLRMESLPRANRRKVGHVQVFWGVTYLMSSLSLHGEMYKISSLWQKFPAFFFFLVIRLRHALAWKPAVFNM